MYELEKMLREIMELTEDAVIGLIAPLGEFLSTGFTYATEVFVGDVCKYITFTVNGDGVITEWFQTRQEVFQEELPLSMARVH